MSSYGVQEGDGNVSPLPPQLVHYSSIDEYRQHYESHYGRAQIYTFDGLRVYFPKQQFKDAFFESASRRRRDKSVFSWQRAERIDWIKAALQDSSADLFVGWNRDKKTYALERRVCVAYGNYVVVLRVAKNKKTATFITAYVADETTIQKIRSGPRWAS